MAQDFTSLHAGTVHNYVWDVGLLEWIKQTATTGGVISGAVDQGAAGAAPWPVYLTRRALTGAAPAQATVDVTSGQAVGANSSRKGLALVNVSANRISLGVGQAAVLNNGITLYPGGVWVMDEYTFSTAAIYAIASSAGSLLAIQEWS